MFFLYIYIALSKKNESRHICQNEERVQSATVGIQSEMSVLKASKLYGVPKSTKRNKIVERSPHSSGHVDLQTVVNDAEKDLEDWTLAVARKGFLINKEQFLDSVKKIVDSSRIETPFQNGRPGKKWYDYFMKCYRKIIQKKQNI